MEILAEFDMNIQIQNSGENGVSNTKGSCAPLANYLDHEDAERAALGLPILHFFKPDGQDVPTEEVINKIDRNIKDLAKKTDKFFHLMVAPSINEVKKMGETELEQYLNAKLFVYFLTIAYLQQFHRPGLENEDQLVIFWKIHFWRDANHELQLHIHGIVSRNAKGVGDRVIKISPLTNHRNTMKGAVQTGFDRTEFYTKCEKIFDELFGYERSVSETFEYNNAMAHGTPEKREEQSRLLAKEEISNKKGDIKEIATLLKKRNDPLSEETKEAINEAVAHIDFSDEIVRSFKEANTHLELHLELMLMGLSLRQKKSEDGVEELAFVKQGKLIKAKDILPENLVKSLLWKWGKLTGQQPAFIVREKRTAEIKAEQEQNISQVTRKIKIRR